LHPATRRQQVQVHADFAAAAADLGRHFLLLPAASPSRTAAPPSLALVGFPL
jgi:hypothetical protein